MRAAVPLFIALVTSAPAAWAQTLDAAGTGASSDAQAEADRLIRDGVELRKDGREAEALELFKKAYALLPSPRALGQMGLAAKSMRLYVESERYLDGALAATDDAWVQQNKEALEQARDVVSKQLGSVVVTCNVPGAELLVNGIVVAKLPLQKPVRVPAGQFLVEVRAPGHTRAEKPASVAAGDTQTISVAIHVIPPPAPEPAFGQAPPPVDAPVSRRPWIYVAGGAGLVGVGVGTYFGIRTLSAKGERDRVCPDQQCPTDEGKTLDDQARTLATWSTLSFAVGVVGLGAATVLWILEPPARKSAGAMHLVAAPTPTGGVAAARWRF